MDCSTLCFRHGYVNSSWLCALLSLSNRATRFYVPVCSTNKKEPNTPFIINLWSKNLPNAVVMVITRKAVRQKSMSTFVEHRNSPVLLDPHFESTIFNDQGRFHTSTKQSTNTLSQTPQHLNTGRVTRFFWQTGGELQLAPRVRSSPGVKHSWSRRWSAHVCLAGTSVELSPSTDWRGLTRDRYAVALVRAHAAHSAPHRSTDLFTCLGYCKLWQLARLSQQWGWASTLI